MLNLFFTISFPFVCISTKSFKPFLEKYLVSFPSTVNTIVRPGHRQAVSLNIFFKTETSGSGFSKNSALGLKITVVPDSELDLLISLFLKTPSSK